MPFKETPTQYRAASNEPTTIHISLVNGHATAASINITEEVNRTAIWKQLNESGQQPDLPKLVPPCSPLDLTMSLDPAAFTNQMHHHKHSKNGKRHHHHHHHHHQWVSLNLCATETKETIFLFLLADLKSIKSYSSLKKLCFVLLWYIHFLCC